MKSIFIALCLALAVFAQEQQEEHKNFTVGQRFETLGLNIIPGLGSVVIMDDWVGAGIQWGLFGTGTVAMVNGFTYDSKDDWDFQGVAWIGLGLYLWSADALFNIFRSATYDNPKYIQQLYKNPGYSNFTVGQRFGTLGLNIIPGLGSVVIMNDWTGAIVQWALVGSGIALIASTRGTYEGVEGALGGALIYVDVAFNIYRSITYNKSENMAFGKYDGFHLSVLPNRHGKIMPYLLFTKALW
jgi:hypothetical protein